MPGIQHWGARNCSTFPQLHGTRPTDYPKLNLLSETVFRFTVSTHGYSQLCTPAMQLPQNAGTFLGNIGINGYQLKVKSHCSMSKFNHLSFARGVEKSTGEFICAPVYPWKWFCICTRYSQCYRHRTLYNYLLQNMSQIWKIQCGSKHGTSGSLVCQSAP